MNLVSIDYVNKLVKLASGCDFVEHPSARDWQTVEQEFDSKFPSNFKELLSAFGTGWFGTGLNLRNPCASADHLRLSKALSVEHHKLLNEIERSPNFPLFPEIGGLLSIGSIDRQEFLLKPGKKKSYPNELFWWDTDMGTIKELRIPVARFIYGLYSGNLKEIWAQELRSYLWRDGSIALFTPWKVPG